MIRQRRGSLPRSSKTTEGDSVGAACFSPDLNTSMSFSVNPQTSVFTAECLAILEATNLAMRNPNRDYRIITDSLSAIASLSRPTDSIKDNKYILDIKQNYVNFLQNNNGQRFMKFEWVPSHSGVVGNEEADRLAVEATRSPPIFPQLMPFTDFRENFKKESLDGTISICIDEGAFKGVEYFEHFYQDERTPWFRNEKLSRRAVSWVNRARANHYHLAASLKRKNLIDSAQCDCGYHSETLDHVLWNCTRYTQNRQTMVQSLQAIDQFPPYNSRNFLKKLDIKCIRIITDFLNASKISV